MKENLTATSAFQLLIQVAADATDLRKQCEELGCIQQWMSHEEGIAIMLATLIKSGYEENFSPKIMTSLLMNYCRDDLVNAFVDFFCQLSKKDGINLSSSDLKSQQFDARMDIHQAAIRGKSVGWKQSWGPFKEPHLSEWIAGFTAP